MRLVLRAILAEYAILNEHLFGSSLRTPLFELSTSTFELGAFVPATRTLRISERLLERPWTVLVEVLKHEMAHQFVFEVLHATDETAHGPVFRRVCVERGIDPGAVGTPAGEVSRQDPETIRQLGRIEKLLALAESDNQHEAEVAMTAARRLMLKYNLTEQASGAEREYSFRHVGEPTGRRMAWQRMLGTILAEFFFVEAIIVPSFRVKDGKHTTVLELCGTEPNLEIAAYTHDFLERTAEALWKRERRETGLSGNSDRLSFLYGVMSGFFDKLRAEAKRGEKEGLVWAGDPQLMAYFRARHPRIRASSSQGAASREAFQKGHAAGEKIVIHRGVEARGSGGPRALLGSGSRR